MAAQGVVGGVPQPSLSHLYYRRPKRWICGLAVAEAERVNIVVFKWDANKEELFIAARLKGGDNWTRLPTLPLCLHNGLGKL